MKYLDFVVLFIIPLIIQLLVYGICFKIKDDLSSFLLLIKEKNLDLYLDTLFLNKISTNTFQLIRILTGLFISAVICSGKLVWFIVLFISVYKLFYLYVYLSFQGYCNSLNNTMPYFIKMIICLCYNNPVNNALVKAVEYIDEPIRSHMSYFVDEIDKKPNDYQPFQDFVDKYQNYVKNIDYYFKSLYRTSNSGDDETSGLLNSLNSSISEDVNNARKRKNDLVNDTISYLGLIPVALLVMALTAVLITAISDI